MVGMPILIKLNGRCHRRVELLPQDYSTGRRPGEKNVPSLYPRNRVHAIFKDLSSSHAQFPELASITEPVRAWVVDPDRDDQGVGWQAARKPSVDCRAQLKEKGDVGRAGVGLDGPY